MKPSGYGILIYPVGMDYQPPFIIQQGYENTRHFYCSNEKASQLAQTVSTFLEEENTGLDIKPF